MNSETSSCTTSKPISIFRESWGGGGRGGAKKFWFYLELSVLGFLVVGVVSKDDG